MANQGKRPIGPDLAEGVPIGDLKDGGMISGRVGEEAVLLARVGDEIFATSARCTHYGGPLGKGVLSGETVRCPWHHACFSLRTGEALRAPAIDRIARWRTEVSDERIAVREKLPKAALRAMKSNSTARDRFVIVGGGAAGFAAAERLRREGFDGELTILSADDDPPVDRPKISKDFLAGKAPEDWVFVKPATFYAEQRIDLHLRARVTRLDASKKEVAVADGRTFAFDKLLLATGADPMRLPMGPSSSRTWSSWAWACGQGQTSLITRAFAWIMVLSSMDLWKRVCQASLLRATSLGFPMPWREEGLSAWSIGWSRSSKGRLPRST